MKTGPFLFFHLRYIVPEGKKDSNAEKMKRNGYNKRDVRNKIWITVVEWYSCSDNGSVSGYCIVNTRHTFIRCNGIGIGNDNANVDGDVEYICRINLIPIDYYSISYHQRCHELLQNYYGDCSIRLNIVLPAAPEKVIIHIYSALLFIGCNKWNPFGNKAEKRIHGTAYTRPPTQTHTHTLTNLVKRYQNVNKASSRSGIHGMHKRAMNNQ